MAWESLIPGPGWLLGAPSILGGLRDVLGSDPTPATEQTQREYQLEQLHRNPEAFWDEPFGQSSSAAAPSPPSPPLSPSPPSIAPPTTGGGGTSSPSPPSASPPAPPPTYDDGNPWTGPPSPPPPAVPPGPRYENLEPWPALPTYPGGAMWEPIGFASGPAPWNIDAQRGIGVRGPMAELLRALQRMAIRPRARVRIRERRPRVRIEDVVGAGIIGAIGGALDPTAVGPGTIGRTLPPRPEPVPVPTTPRLDLPRELALPPGAPDPWNYQMPQPPIPAMGAPAAPSLPPSGGRFPWPALGLLAPLLRNPSSRSTASTLTTPRFSPPSVPPSVPQPPTPPNSPPGGGGGGRLTPFNPVSVGFPSERRCRCEKCKKPKRGKPRKCLERAQVVWRSGSNKGKVAGTRCVRFAAK